MPVPAGPSSVIDVDEVKTRLKIPLTTTTHDDKIQSMIDSAEAEYDEWVGPLAGTVTEVLDGGLDTLILRDSGATAITAASYESGATLTFTDLNVTNGIVRWNYGTAGRFNTGRVSITYTVGTLPTNHREAIIADVAGYFAATQRAGEPRTDENGYAGGFFSTPTNLFPRIRALALPGIA